MSRAENTSDKLVLPCLTVISSWVISTLIIVNSNSQFLLRGNTIKSGMHIPYRSQQNCTFRPTAEHMRPKNTPYFTTKLSKILSDFKPLLAKSKNRLHINSNNKIWPDEPSTIAVWQLYGSFQIRRNACLQRCHYTSLQYCKICQMTDVRWFS